MLMRRRPHRERGFRRTPAGRGFLVAEAQTVHSMPFVTGAGNDTSAFFPHPNILIPHKTRNPLPARCGGGELGGCGIQNPKNTGDTGTTSDESTSASGTRVLGFHTHLPVRR